MSIYRVTVLGLELGRYEADSEASARDACARDAGYESEADMAERLEQLSMFEVTILPSDKRLLQAVAQAVTHARENGYSPYDAVETTLQHLLCYTHNRDEAPEGGWLLPDGRTLEAYRYAGFPCDVVEWRIYGGGQV